jgi:hypothetical protein
MCIIHAYYTCLIYICISFVAETNRRFYPHLNKHAVPDTIEVDEDDELEPSAKKIKTRHLNFVNSFVVLDAPTRPHQSQVVTEDSSTEILRSPSISE